jgi:hypothetical protein
MCARSAKPAAWRSPDTGCMLPRCSERTDFPYLPHAALGPREAALRGTARAAQQAAACASGAPGRVGCGRGARRGLRAAERARRSTRSGCWPRIRRSRARRRRCGGWRPSCTTSARRPRRPPPQPRTCCPRPSPSRVLVPWRARLHPQHHMHCAPPRVFHLIHGRPVSEGRQSATAGLCRVSCQVVSLRWPRPGHELVRVRTACAPHPPAAA